MIQVIRIEEIRMCFECNGKGFVENVDYNTLERVTKKCRQCNGSGLLKLTGNIEVAPFIAYNGTCHDDHE